MIEWKVLCGPGADVPRFEATPEGTRKYAIELEGGGICTANGRTPQEAMDWYRDSHVYRRARTIELLHPEGGYDPKAVVLKVVDGVVQTEVSEV